MDDKDHRLCMIPGPVEFHEGVLKAMSHAAVSHVDPKFVEVFGACIEKLRKIFFTNDAQPFILSGSGVLGWDAVAVNLLQPNDEALVLSTGVFGDRFVDSLEAYGAKVNNLRAPLGGNHDLQEVENELKRKLYKLVTITHVDTSTGVLSDVKGLARLIKAVLPEALIVVDAVCAAAAEN
ncbi:hypothetical protein L0F63_002362 [Massospora cicadina]|nr:hypothetical protein L0F63_002362 [Massospora cicadina]